MRRAACLLLVPAIASADDSVDLHAHASEDEAPLLVLDPLLTSRFESVHADEKTENAIVPIGRGIDAILENTTWANDDIAQRGWRAAAGLTRDFGVARLTATASYSGTDGRFGDGRYVDLTIALTRTFKLSRWMTAFISLSLGVRRWQGVPPPGESNSAAAMLSVGTTFR